MGGLSAFAVVSVALVMGMAVMAIVFAARRVSYGFLNPALTLGALVAMRIDFVKAIVFVIVQILGGIAGSACLLAALPNSRTKIIFYKVLLFSD